MIEIVKRLILSLLVATLLSPTLFAQPDTPDEKEQSAQKADSPKSGWVFVGSNSNEPYSFVKDGEPAGFDVDVMRAVAQRAGKTLEIRLVEPDRVKAMVADGQATGVLGMGVVRGEVDPRTEWRLCGPTLEREYWMLVREDFPRVGDDVKTTILDGTRVALLQDDPVKVLFENARGVSLDIVRKPANGCIKVSVGLVKALVADLNTIRYGLGQGNLEDLRLIGQPVFSITQYGPAVPIDQTDTAELISGAIAVMQGPNGQLAMLRDKWFGHELPTDPFWQRSSFWLALIALAAAILLSLTAMAWRKSIVVAVAGRTRKLNAEMEVLRKQLHDLEVRSGLSASAVVLDDHTESQAVANVDGESDSPDEPVGIVPLGLNELIESMGEELRNSVGQAAEFTVKLGENLPPVLADEGELRQVLVHLCSNARDALRARTGEQRLLPARVWLTTRPAEPTERPAHVGEGLAYVAVSVRDTGCGIDQADVQKIFSAGYTTKKDAEGKGLAFVYEVVGRHHGWIDVESAPQRGATFSIFLPAADM